MLEKLSKAGRVGVNVNGDLPEKEIAELSRFLSERVKIIWIGENPLFIDPFKVAEIVAENFEHLVGFGVLTPRKRAEEIYENFKRLEKDYGERFVLGVASGGFKLKDYEKFLKKLKEKFDEFLCGVTWLKSYEIAKKYCSGILLNHVHPKHVEVFKDYDGFKAAYGPALILPSEFYQDLIIACSIVMQTSKDFLKKFSYYKSYEKIKEVRIEELIKKRQRGENLENNSEYEKLKAAAEKILEFFTISGKLEDVSNRVKELLSLCDHVVLGDPFFRDKKSVERVSLLLSRLGLS
ncbi:conserved hypothetical protein [Ferroglobus placidus DSM 10642]|uniref:Uncharacterized protein n=1 Tax=Ferroglobus placidus (strain DSM 10642 / AEDII12DO) TaxID=589924 RepID=D3S028_FERPA|nr:hypothetical protein [Ferroglobus placidus]ADC66091.1 conserved hypothetical protein [Ferroglobus placidus DSM 10642]